MVMLRLGKSLRGRGMGWGVTGAGLSGGVATEWGQSGAATGGGAKWGCYGAGPNWGSHGGGVKVVPDGGAGLGKVVTGWGGRADGGGGDERSPPCPGCGRRPHRNMVCTLTMVLASAM